MAAQKRKDEFSQMAYIAVVESGANSLTFNGISVFSNILTPKGMILHQVEYNINAAAYALLVAAGDAIIFGLSGDDSAAAVALDDAQTYDYNVIQRVDFGAAASGGVVHAIHNVDWTGLPGGGKLVPADRLFGYVQGASIASALSIAIRLQFTLKDLNAQQYIELAQSLRVLT